ncbi:MAG: hypothetical protein DRO65_00245 [Candidatus Altiarchaeales archaeon]|nr:MAG: hypothetical protein DRO65_00245 [Candidatus Altiarchaeales archaeon]
MEINSFSSHNRNELKFKRIILNCLHTIESIGLTFASVLYDSKRKVFSDAILIESERRIQSHPIPWGSPSITHRLLFALLQHPKLEFLIRKLKINFANFLRNLKISKSTNMFEYFENGKRNFGHTFSLFFVFTISNRYNLWDVTSSSRPPSPSEYIDFNPKSLRQFLQDWQNDLDSYRGEEKFLEYFDSLLRILSFYPYCDKTLKPIVKEYLHDMMGKFLSLKRTHPACILYLLAETSLVNLSLPQALQSVDYQSLYEEIIDDKNPVTGILSKNNYEETLMYLCGLAELFPVDLFANEMNQIINQLSKVNILRECRYSLSRRVAERAIIFLKKLYEGEKIYYLSCSLPLYLLRLASIIRKRYSSIANNYPLPFSNSTIKLMFLMKKG